MELLISGYFINSKSDISSHRSAEESWCKFTYQNNILTRELFIWSDNRNGIIDKINNVDIGFVIRNIINEKLFFINPKISSMDIPKEIKDKLNI